MNTGTTVDSLGTVTDASPTASTTQLVAVDLGSNSFKLVVAEEADGGLRHVDRLRERVALAEGLREDGKIAPDVADRALECLERFRQRLVGIPPNRIRAVGTATFRKIKKRSFLRKAEAALGHEIEVLPGKEEARLVYLGVAHSLGDDVGKRLVVDIGGASTECILGERFESTRERSLSMGCVRWTMRFFGEGKVSRRRIEQAELAARIELEPIEREFRQHGWDSCIGSSGTILAVAEILARQGWGDGSVTPRGLSKLTRAVTAAGRIDALALEGLKEDRKPVLVGGLAVLRAVFAGLGIKQMSPTKGAVREGLLYDLLGRIHHEDVRMRSVRDFARRFGVDEEHAERVRESALALFDQVAGGWQLTDGDRRLLGWASELHEVGLAVSWLSHHKHGAYLIQHADLPGFSSERRDRLAWLVQAHRRRVTPPHFGQVSGARDERTLRLAVILRLAVRLHRNRGTVDPPPLRAEVAGQRVSLGFPDGHLEGHPLTRAEMEDEGQVLAPLGIQLTVG